MPNFDFSTLITDRTQANLDALLKLLSTPMSDWTSEKLAEFNLAKSKGAYNYTDLNRVGQAVAYLAARLDIYGYDVTVSPKTNWTVADVPTTTTMAQYLTDVAAIRAVLPVPDTTPETPASMDRLTWQTANDIEQILVDVEAVIQRLASSLDLGWTMGLAHTGLYGGI